MFDTERNPIAEAKMYRTSCSTCSILMVEGRDDVKFWGGHCHRDCRPIYCGGKDKVISVMGRLDEDHFSGVLAVIDSNYDHLAGVVSTDVNIVRTDAHDLECLLCRSTALDAVLREHGNRDKIERFEREHTSVRTALLDRAATLGRLRWAGRKFEPNLSLDSVRPPAFIEERTWKLSEKRMIEMATDSNPHAEEAALSHAIVALPAVDPWYVASGHDVLEILRIGLRRVLGELKASVGVDQLASVLRQGMAVSELQSTRVWRDIREWEASNRPFLVLQN